MWLHNGTLHNGTLQNSVLHTGTLHNGTLQYGMLQNECCYKTVRGTKRYVTIRYGYKTVTITKPVLQNGNRYYGLGGRLL